MRCFIALDLPSEIKIRLDAAQESMREILPDARWTQSEGHHITLAFLGDLNKAGLDCALHAAESMAGFGALPLRFAGLLGFPHRPPHRVLALSVVDTGPEELGRSSSRIHDSYVKLNEALRAAELRAGLPPLNEEYPSGRPFHPHATLARCELPEIDKDIMRELASCQESILEEAFHITHCVVYESRLSSAGAEYHPLLKVELEAFKEAGLARG